MSFSVAADAKAKATTVWCVKCLIESKFCTCHRGLRYPRTPSRLTWYGAQASHSSRYCAHFLYFDHRWSSHPPHNSAPNGACAVTAMFAGGSLLCCGGMEGRSLGLPYVSWTIRLLAHSVRLSATGTAQTARQNRFAPAQWRQWCTRHASGPQHAPRCSGGGCREQTVRETARARAGQQIVVLAHKSDSLLLGQQACVSARDVPPSTSTAITREAHGTDLMGGHGVSLLMGGLQPPGLRLSESGRWEGEV